MARGGLRPPGAAGRQRGLLQRRPGAAGGDHRPGARRRLALARSPRAALRAQRRLRARHRLHRVVDPGAVPVRGPEPGRRRRARGTHRPVPGRGRGGLGGARRRGRGRGAARQPALQLPGGPGAPGRPDPPRGPGRRRAARDPARDRLARPLHPVPQHARQKGEAAAGPHADGGRHAHPVGGQRAAGRAVHPLGAARLERGAGGARAHGNAWSRRLQSAAGPLLHRRRRPRRPLPARRAPGRLPAARRAQRPGPERRLRSRRHLPGEGRQGPAGKRRRHPARGLRRPHPPRQPAPDGGVPEPRPVPLPLGAAQPGAGDGQRLASRPGGGPGLPQQPLHAAPGPPRVRPGGGLPGRRRLAAAGRPPP